MSPCQSVLFALRRQPTPGARPSTTEDALERANLPPWLTEYRFTKMRRWRFDYAWPDFHIALEIEGGVFGRMIVIERGHERRRGRSIPLKPGTRVRVGGRHNSGKGLEDDCVKYNHAATLGWTVIRVTTRMVRDGEAITALRAAFHARGLE
jgi:hypothetical protein